MFRSLALAAALLAPALPAPTLAQPPARRAADITVVGAEDAGAGRLREVIEELLGRRAVAVRWSQAPRLDPAEVLAARPAESALLLRAWIDLDGRAAGRGARLYVTSASTERVLIREIPLAGGLDELGREAIGQVVDSAAAVLLEDASTLGVSRAEARAALGVADSARPPPREAPPTRATPSPVRLGASYHAQGLAEPTPVAHGPALAIGIEPRGPWRVTVAAGYQLPVAIEPDPVGVRLSSFAFRLMGGARIAAAGPLALGIEAGAGADWVRLEPRVAAGVKAEATQARRLLFPMARVAAALELAVSARLGLALGAGAEIDPIGVHYDFQDVAETRTVLRPWRVRPLLTLGGWFR